MKKTAVEWLAEKFEYVNWMRNRDEISAGIADEWRKHYLEQAKEMEKEQIIEAHGNKQKTKSNPNSIVTFGYTYTGQMYYDEKYKGIKPTI